MGAIIIPGFPTGMLAPGIYINVELGRQPPSAAGAVRKVLLVGKNPGAPSTTEANRLYKVSRLRSGAGSDEDSAEALFGRNLANPRQTLLYWMAYAAFEANPLVSLYAIRVADSGTDPYGTVLDPVNGKAATQQFHYIALDDPTDTAGGPVDKLVNYLGILANPVYGIRQQGVVGMHFADSKPTAVPNNRDPRLQYVWCPQAKNYGSEPPFNGGDFYLGSMLAAAVAAIRSRHESVDPAVNLSMERVPGVPVPPMELTATKSNLNDYLSWGYTPLVQQGTNTVILRSVTTVANVTDNTYPVLDTSKVTVTDFVADDIEMKMLNRYTGFKLAPDTDIPPPSMTATPRGIKSSLLEWLREHEKAGRITMVTDLSERVLVEIDEEVPGRVNFQIPEDVIEIFAVGAGNIIQIG